MKTTVEVDEKRLKRVMKLTGLKTKRSAIDAALQHLERAELRKRLIAEKLKDSDWLDALDANYELDGASQSRETIGGVKVDPGRFQRIYQLDSGA